MDGTVALAITRRVDPAASSGSFISWNNVKATKPSPIMQLQQNVFGARLSLSIRKIKQCLKSAYNPLNDLSVAFKKKLREN